MIHAKAVLQFPHLSLNFFHRDDEPEDLVFRLISIENLIKEINIVLNSPYLVPEKPFKWSKHDDNDEFKNGVANVFSEADVFDFLPIPEYLSEIFRDLPDPKKSAIQYRFRIALMNVQHLIRYDGLHSFLPTEWAERMMYLSVGHLPVFYCGILSY